MTESIISLTEEREKRRPHVRGPAICLACRHGWEAVSPEGTIWMECPQCTLMRGRYRYHCLPSHGLVWQCACGSDVFYILPDGYLCPNCGKQVTKCP